MDALGGAALILALAGRAVAAHGDGDGGSVLFLAQAPTPGPVPVLELPEPDSEPPPGCPDDDDTTARQCRLEADLEAARRAEREAGDDLRSQRAARERTARAEYALALARCESLEAASGGPPSAAGSGPDQNGGRSRQSGAASPGRFTDQSEMGSADAGRARARAADCRARADAARERAMSEAARLPSADEAGPSTPVPMSEDE